MLTSIDSIECYVSIIPCYNNDMLYTVHIPHVQYFFDNNDTIFNADNYSSCCTGQKVLKMCTMPKYSMLSILKK